MARGMVVEGGRVGRFSGWELERYRVELTRYCYRMLGAASDAEDAVQETFERAWRGVDRFEGRSSLRTWLYRIAINVCFDMLRGRRRRALPMDLGPAAPADTPLGAALPDHAWVQPIPDERVLDAVVDPAEQAVDRDTVRLAFVAALQYLLPRQRAVLILRDVLRWKASEVAEVLDVTVMSVHGLLRRARAVLAAKDLGTLDPADLADGTQRDLLARYVDAFEHLDVEALVSLLREDATLSMPPYPLWLRGVDDIRRWMRRESSTCHSTRLLAVSANGSPGVAIYRPTGPAGGYEPFAIQVLEVSGDTVGGIHAFLDTSFFPLFGLPRWLEPR